MYIQQTKVRQWERGKRRDHPEEGATTTGEVKLGTHREGTGVNDSVFLVSTLGQKAERVCALSQASPQDLLVPEMSFSAANEIEADGIRGGGDGTLAAVRESMYGPRDHWE